MSKQKTLFRYYSIADFEECKPEDIIYQLDFSDTKGMERLFKARMIPLLIIFACILMPQLISNLIKWGNRGFMNRGPSFVFSVLFGILFFIYMYLFVRFGGKLAAIKRKYGYGK